MNNHSGTQIETFPQLIVGIFFMSCVATRARHLNDLLSLSIFAIVRIAMLASFNSPGEINNKK